MKTQLRKLTQGFTIIEVMIVLAIAGLIMAIIFLAVPALQRNTHNNSRRSDAAHLAGIVNEYAANHSGQLPAVGSPSANLVTSVSGEKWAIMASPTVVANGTGTLGTLTTMVVNTGTSCDTTLQVPVVASNATRSFTISYNVEASGGGLGGNGSASCIQG